MSISRIVLSSAILSALAKSLWYDGLAIWKSQFVTLHTRLGVRPFSAAWLRGRAVLGRGIVFLLTLAGLIGVSLRWAPFASQASPSLATLAVAAGPIRPSPGRLTGGFAHAPFHPEGPRFKPSKEFIETALKLTAPARRSQNGDGLEEAGLLNLIEGKIKLGIDLLWRAVEREAPNASLQNNLAAAYLAQGHAESSPLLYWQALSAAEKAVELDELLLEARFNRALALDFIGISWEAERAWRSYLNLDPSSEWADEARQRLRSLMRVPRSEVWEAQKEKLESAALRNDHELLKKLVFKFPLQSRLHGEELLGKWARLQQEGDLGGAQPVLDLVRELGSVTASITHDHMLPNVVEAIDRYGVSRIGKKANLVEGLLAYQEGLMALEGRDHIRAVFLFMSARRRLIRADNPLSLWASVHLAASLFHENRYAEAQRLLDEVRLQAEVESYPNLHGQLFRLLGLIETVRSRYDLAYVNYMEALKMYERSGESESAASIHALIFEYFYLIGEQVEGLRHLSEALFSYTRIPAPKKHMVLWCGSLAASREGHLEFARYFQDEAVRLAQAEREPVNIISALRARAVTFLEIGKKEEALRDLAEAKKYLVEVPSARTRDELLGLILLTESELQRTREPRLALEAAEEALAIARRTGYHAGLPWALLARARAFVALAAPVRAGEDFAATFQEIDRQRGNLLSPSSRERFFNEARPIFDESVAFHASVLGRPDLAYKFVEHAQARLLLDKVAGGRGTELPQLEEICHRLPVDVVLLQFSVLPERTLVWLISPGEVRFGNVKVGEKALAREVDAFRLAILKSDEELIDRLGRLLYSRLLGETVADMAATSKIVLIPDKALHYLPFAALKNPKSGKFLIEERTLETAPSARIYLHNVALVAKGLINPPSLLLVADPELDLKVLPHLADLRFSQEEVAAIRPLFGDARVLTGSSATKKTLLEEAPRHSFLHLATHAIVNQSDPLYSYLALSPDGDSGLLYAHELYEADLRGLHLVFLAGCETAMGPISKSEGVLSLARPFLAAGVSAVVGAHWKVSDRAASAFTPLFYKNLAKGMSASAALRATQRVLATSSDMANVSNWAGFVLIGADGRVTELP